MLVGYTVAELADLVAGFASRFTPTVAGTRFTPGGRIIWRRRDNNDLLLVFTKNSKFDCYALVLMSYLSVGAPSPMVFFLGRPAR